MSDRFVLHHLHEHPGLAEKLDAQDNTCSAVYDTIKQEYVGWDGGEPEDQLLCRDWDWVVAALNAVDDEVENCYHRGDDE